MAEYIDCNQAFLDIMGYEREEVIWDKLRWNWESGRISATGWPW